MTLAKTLRLQANDPSRAGAYASKAVTFGEFSRFQLAAIHTRFEAVTWMVFDAEQEDELTGKPKIIRQEDSAAEAIKGLPGAEEVEL